MQRKYDCTNLDIHSFFEVVESLCVKVFRPVKPQLNEEGEPIDLLS
jgi:hypothetical protein